jgi:hypothetical protein
MKITINDIEVDAIVDNDTALTKSVNKMQSLSSRNGSFSTEIEAALSTNNRQLTANSQSTDSVTNFPYGVNSCEIEAHGYNVMKGFATLEETSNNYKIRAFGELSNVFDLIGDAKLKELNLDYSNGSSINHIWNYANVIANRNNAWSDGFIYPNINYGKWDSNTVRANWNDLYPSVFAKYLFLRIFHSIGYSVVGEFLDNELFENEIVPMVKIPSTPSYALDGFKTQSTKISQTYLFDNPPFGTLDPKNILFDILNKNGDFQLSNEIVNGTYATILRPSNYGITKLNFSLTSDVVIGFSAIIQAPSVGYLDIKQQTLAAGLNTFSFEVEKTVPDLFIRFVIDTPVSIPYTVNLSGTLNTETASTILVEGNTVYVNECLPDVSQKDFLTTIVNQYNLMITIDSSLRTVNFSYFNSVDTNKSNAIDWTDKLDITDLPTIQYAIDGYGQNNLLSYETDDNDIELRKANTYGQGTLFCNNLNLEKTTEVFKSKFAPIVRVPALRDPITQAFIQLWKSEDGGTTYRTQSVKPRIAYINRGETFTIHGTSGAIGGGGGASNSGPSSGVYFQDLEFAGSLIPKFYNIVVNMLNSPYFLSANFFLKVKDYNEIDFTKPIYLDCIIKGYGNIKGYFYCNEIKQFKINRYETTEVELIKI